MSKIVYLLGAGASRGKRTWDNKPLGWEEIDLEDTNDIIEGLPLVSEIPARLDYIIKKIDNIPDTAKTSSICFPIGSNMGTSYEEAKRIIISDLTWLKNESEKHATIDTFAKKLYLKGLKQEFYKVETLLSVFFIIEQIINKKDGRYDTFLASVLNANLNIDKRITILTWNYDSQFELAYKEYGELKDAENIRKKLGIVDLKDQSLVSNPQIFKINGTANFMQQLDLSKYIDLNENLLIDLLDMYIMKLNEQETNSRISFAWDNKKYTTDFFTALTNSIQDAEILIVIGYTFPFFNREIDKGIFALMPNLKKVYIQDPNAKQIVGNLDALYSPSHIRVMMLNQNIYPITNTAQFYLPPEL